MNTAGDTLKNLTPEDVRRLEVLSKIGKRFNTPERFSEALGAVLDAVIESLEAERGAVFLVEANSDKLRLAKSRDTTEERSEESFRYSSTVVDKVWTTLEPLTEVDTLVNADLARRSSIQAEGIRSVICVPLVGGQSRLGVLYLDTRLSNAFTRADLQMLDVIADLASTALERARFFDALQALNEDLEARVQKRTAEAEAARLEAERATRAKSLFLAKMSHELRTPLNGVLGLTEDLASREKNPALRVQLQQIVQSARSLSTLINGVLDFSKLESDHVVLESHRFDPEEIVLSSIANINYEANQKGLELQVWIDPSVPSQVEGDSIRLAQILINLLSNAVKFTSEGYVRLLVSAPSDGKLAFSVADSGLGIPKEKQSEVFKPFSQADISTTREYGGTGLGLSICQALCRLFGSELILESQPGQGSRFTFEVSMKFLREFETPDFKGSKVWLSVPSQAQQLALEKVLTGWGCEISQDPKDAALSIVTLDCKSEVHSDRVVELVDPGQSIDEEENSNESKRHLLTPVTRSGLLRALADLFDSESPNDDLDKEVEPHPPQGAVALIVEDHEINRLVMKKMLESWGYDCHLACDGNEAIEMTERLHPHLILMDIEMPTKDGFSTTRKLRLSKVGMKVPVIAVTAHLAPDLRERCLAAGMDDLLIKPILRRTVAERLCRWEAYLAGEIDYDQVRHKDFSELNDWPGRFLSPITSTLSTLTALVRTEGSAEQLDNNLKELETLSFSAGLSQWAVRCASLPRPLEHSSVAELIDQFQQEWRTLAPRLLP